MDDLDEQNSEATDEDVERVDDASETMDADPGGSETKGAGGSPKDPSDTDENQDPKSGHSPV